MNNSQIRRILSGLKYSTDTRIQTPEFRALILSENQGIDYKREFITFDTENSLIRIKKFTYNVISGRISSNVTINGQELRANNSLYLRHNLYPFRAPRIGDKIIIIKSDGKYNDSGLTIETTATNYLKLTGELTSKIFDKTTDQICYADPYWFDKSVQDPVTPALFFNYTEVSNHNDDVFLDTNDLIGIEMQSSLLGSV